MEKQIIVPIRKLNPLRILRQEVPLSISNRFRGSFLAFDIDQTLVQTDRVEPEIITTFSNRPVLQEIVKFLELKIPVVIISGNDLNKQRLRVIPPLLDFLNREKKLHLLKRFHFFANTGASRVFFNERGEEDNERFNAHLEKYCITSQVQKKLRNIFNEDFQEFIEVAEKGKRLEIRQYNGKILQITLKPFKQKEREAAISLILKRFSDNGISNRDYSVLAAGSTSVDIARIGISKAKAIEIIMEEMGIPLLEHNSPLLNNPVYYFGDEFNLTSDDLGHSIYGNDIPVLSVPNVIAFAVNSDQSQVPMHPRLLKAGSGPTATLKILRYFRENLEKAVTNITAPPDVPVITKKKIDIPKMIKELDFQKTAIALRINSILVDPMQKQYFNEDEKVKSQNLVLAAIVKLLRKDIKIVLLSGDSKAKQLKVVETIFNLLKITKHQKKIDNLTLYANNGASKTTFSQDAQGELKLVEQFEENSYTKERKIDRSKLGDMPQEVLKLYTQLLKDKIGEAEQEAKMYLKEIENTPKDKLVEFRDGESQLAFNYIMPQLRQKLIEEIKRLLPEDKAADLTIREGGVRTIHINHQKANKIEALRDYSKCTGIENFLYLGTQFFHNIHHTGAIISGSDMEMLEINELIALALNLEQEEISALGNPQRIVAGGSGANAAYTWLDYIAASLSFSI